MNSPDAWYVRKDGVVHGPASLQDLRHLLRVRQITLTEEASGSQNGPWQPLGNFPEFMPVRPISELFQSPAAPPSPPVALQRGVSPTAEALLASVLNEAPTGAPGSLSSPARLEFSQALFKETEKIVENKCFPWAISIGGLTLILLARFNMIVAAVAAAIVAGITFKIIKAVLESKYLDPIEKMSDEMLVSRYNEMKADQRAAKTRSAIGWAVIAIIGVIILVALLALRSSS